MVETEHGMEECTFIEMTPSGFAKIHTPRGERYAYKNQGVWDAKPRPAGALPWDV